MKTYDGLNVQQKPFYLLEKRQKQRKKKKENNEHKDG